MKALPAMDGSNFSEAAAQTIAKQFRTQDRELGSRSDRGRLSWPDKDSDGFCSEACQKRSLDTAKCSIEIVRSA
ncbi:MAG: hypothetical protein ACM3JB_04400 [Acidobacteriaceae bacterium]